MMNQILEAINNVGGRPLFVGGCVRDKVMGIKPKDFDVEVFNMTADKLAEVLSDFGTVNLVGSSFGVIKLRLTDGTEFDFALPRRENKVGRGHKGFMVKPDSTMTPEEAASRRDFTFNAMAEDPFTGEILDFFGGQEDLKKGILRHAGPAFAEDPLRVPRGWQFCGRFGLKANFKTVWMSFKLRKEFHTIAKERVWGEWWKWATKSTIPSMGLNFLVQTKWVELFPELNDLINCPQDPVWHPEGDVWVHTKHVCDKAVKIAIREGLSEIERGILVLTALCHDIGKPKTTIKEDGRWKSPGHDKVGEGIARTFLSSIGAPNEIIDQVCELVREHMVHVNGEPSKRVVRRFLSRLKFCSVKQVMMIIEADHSGRPPLAKGLPKEAQMFADISAEMEDKIEPILMGRHLIEKGFKPGPEMGKILKRAFEAQIEGEFSDLEGAIKWVLPNG